MNDGIVPVKIPQAGVNDDQVSVSQIYAKAGQKVVNGDLLFSISTSKVDFDVEAEADGYFWPVVKVGSQLDVGAVAGFISKSSKKPVNIKETNKKDALPNATQKATMLANRLGVDLNEIKKRGIIRVRDVEEYSKELEIPSRAEIATSSSKKSKPPKASGALDPEFLTSIKKKDSGFPNLSSELKITLYKRFGAKIGDNVKFGLGSAIYAESIEIGDGCEFGDNSVIKAQTLRLGVGCLFGEDNDIMCRHIDCGDMLFLSNRVLIGQGGAFNDEAELIVGHSCLISSDCLINTAHKVTIGDRSCLSPRVCIYTHSHWQNVLEGYKASFAPVAIGNDVWITGNCLITPGAVLEDGSQALANSVVSGRVPKRTIISGVPAKPVARVRGELSLKDKDILIRKIWAEVEKALARLNLNLAEAAYTGSVPKADSEASVQVAFGKCPRGYKGTFFDLNEYKVTGAMNQVANEVRNVFRKHGIRFEPHIWRYRGDLGRFNA
jgi:acetyltransferase-like isoleucine patch superfamily enzyme